MKKSTSPLSSCNRRRGAVLVIVAISLVTLLTFVGLVIDSAIWYDAHTLLQSIADQAAIAGAIQLPSGTAGATKAAAVVTANGGSASEIITSQVVGTNQYEIVLRRYQPAIFAAVIGISRITISVRAVAQSDTGSGGSGGTYSGALASVIYTSKEFSSGSTPQPFSLTGSSLHVNGIMQINGNLSLTSSSSTFTGAIRTGHTLSIVGSSNTFSGGTFQNQPIVAAPTYDLTTALTTAKAASRYYVYAASVWKQWNPAMGALSAPAVAPTGFVFSGANLSYTGSSGTINGTIYLQGGGISITGSSLNGTASFITDGNMTVTASSATFSSASAFGFYTSSASSSAFTFTGSSTTWYGTFAAPNGGFSLTGSSCTFVGGIWAGAIPSLIASSCTFTYDSTRIASLPLPVTTPKIYVHLVN